MHNVSGFLYEEKWYSPCEVHVCRSVIQYLAAEAFVGVS